MKFGRLCTSNTFSYFLSDYKAYYPGLLYDISLALIYDRFGFNGVALAGGLIITLSSYFFSKLLLCPDWLKDSLFFLFYFLSLTVFGLGVRPQVASYLFFAATLFVLDKARARHKHLFWLTPLFLVWVNSHIGFFLGPILFGFWFCEKFLKFLRAKSQKAEIKKVILPFAFLLIALFATLINPFGGKVYLEIWRHSSSPLPAMIAEWVPPLPWQMGLITMSGLISLISLIWKGKISVYKLLLLGFFTILALKARRNLPFFYTVFFYVVWNSNLVREIVRRRDAINGVSANVTLSLLVLAAALLFSLSNFSNALKFNNSRSDYCAKGLIVYPCELVPKLKTLKGNVFATYEWGGFLIWQTPNLKVFVDGRMPAWKDENGESPYEVFLYILQAREGWNERLARYKTDYILIAPGTFLDLLLEKEALKYGWSEIHRDETAVLYERI